MRNVKIKRARMSPAAFMAVDLAISWKLPSPLLYVFSLQGLGGSDSAET
jgi:hypothetical protein